MLNGVAISSLATTVTAGLFIGSATAFGMSAFFAGLNSSSLQDFADQGNWGTVLVTVLNGLIGGGNGYVAYRAFNPKPQSKPNANVTTSKVSISKKAPKPVCFVAGTLILTEHGHKPIEEIQAGDFVWAENPETGEKSLKRVLQAFVRESDELVHIKVDGQDITTTPEHPFWVPQQGWTDAIELRAGDILLLSNGEYVIIEAVQHEILEAPVTVYNFEVEDFHTYFVGSSSVLVHNICYGGSAAIKMNDKNDIYHSFPRQVDNYVYTGIKTTTSSGYTFYQVPGSINGQSGYYTYGFTIDGICTHRCFETRLRY